MNITIIEPCIKYKLISDEYNNKKTAICVPIFLWKKLSKEKAKEPLHAHIGGSQNRTSGDIELMKVRT